MKEYKDLIPVEYYAVKKNVLIARLDELPVVNEGKHRGLDVYRVYEKGRKRKEISRKDSSWDKVTKIKINAI
ncbi:hypothetical protein SAMN02910456_01903 [Ruminococcaceae bacterium YRB3002]|nr:hypothetical protein SAMN02910456_01903 [Ruminococcaceae bacterium YRB3002]